jgi:hypothetical protein
LTSVAPASVEGAGGRVAGYLILLARPRVRPGRLLIVMDTSPSMDGEPLYYARSALSLLARAVGPRRVGLVTFCSKPRVMGPEELGDEPWAVVRRARICPGTNLARLLKTLDSIIDEYDSTVIVTDAQPTLGPRKPEKLASIASGLAGRGRIVLVPAGENYDATAAEAIAGASGAIIGPPLSSPWQPAAYMLAASGIGGRVVAEVAVAHPPWLSVEAPGAGEARDGWTVIPAARFSLDGEPLPLIIKPSPAGLSDAKELGERVALPVALHLLDPAPEGVRETWRVRSVLEYPSN